MENDVVFFDGVCNLCSASVQRIIKYDKNDRFKFASLQSEYAQSIILDEKLKKTDSIVLMRNGKFYVKSAAVLRIVAHLRFPLNLLSVFMIIPRFISDGVYDLIASNRYKWFGKKEYCWLPDEKLKRKFIA